MDLVGLFGEGPSEELSVRPGPRKTGSHWERQEGPSRLGGRGEAWGVHVKRGC